MVLSMIQRRGRTEKPRTCSFLWTTSASMPRVAACSTYLFLKPVSDQVFSIVGWSVLAWLIAAIPALLSVMEAAKTITARSRPRVSVTMVRFLPTIFLASIPWASVGTSVEVLMLWVSVMARVWSALRLAGWRARAG